MGKVKYDLTGQVFGHLKAVKYANNSMWECECLRCGQKGKLVKSEHLRNGHIDSCGCLKKEQETRGKRGTNCYFIKTAKGVEVMVDAEDMHKLSKHSWSIGSDGYPQAKVYGRMVRMHEFLIGQYRGPGMVIDHINRDRLDNRKENLRVVSPSDNAMNRSNMVS